MPHPRITLASSSPRRAKYLKGLGYKFERLAPEVIETQLPGERARRFVRRLSMAKASEIANRRPENWIVAADTTVVIDERLLGKPKHEASARRMLRALSGRSHRVLTGITLLNAALEIHGSRVCSTRVTFRPLTAKEVRWYIETGEPFDKAGAYAIQGLAGLFVERIEGSFSNVVGFPLETFYSLAMSVGFPLPMGNQTIRVLET